MPTAYIPQRSRPFPTCPGNRRARRFAAMSAAHQRGQGAKRTSAANGNVRSFSLALYHCGNIGRNSEGPFGQRHIPIANCAGHSASARAHRLFGVMRAATASHNGPQDSAEHEARDNNPDHPASVRPFQPSGKHNCRRGDLQMRADAFRHHGGLDG